MFGSHFTTSLAHQPHFPQFMARYKGYKIPLAHLRSGQLLKQLHEAGSRIVATPEQAKSLEAIKELLVISETETPTIDESEVAKSVESLKEFMTNLSDASTTDGVEPKQAAGSAVLAHDLAELLAEEGMEEEDEEEWVSPQTKAAKKRKVEAGKAAIELMGKFVNVTDILPPLPKRGSFKVETIKGSQYFFS